MTGMKNTGVQVGEDKEKKSLTHTHIVEWLCCSCGSSRAPSVSKNMKKSKRSETVYEDDLTLADGAQTDRMFSERRRVAMKWNLAGQMSYT